MSMIDDASDETADAVKKQRERHQKDEQDEQAAESDDDEMSGNVPTANLE